MMEEVMGQVVGDVPRNPTGIDCKGNVIREQKMGESVPGIREEEE